ncbi:MAG: carbon monoxide dehydrogenase [Verrucomicrobia bacterium]|nr:MAG: carbon monoxide dehydrogenase [Verrucomicrobiota bacterium]
MIPAAFDYLRPQSLNEAIRMLADHAADCKVLAGGHSLIPAMKLRLAQPKTIIDISRIADLSYIRHHDGQLAIGAMTTHYEIESSALVREKCPLLAEVASQIGDVQVRNKGTIGGSLVHADPAADWPAPILALDAELAIADPTDFRAVPAKEFFVDLMQTAVRPNDILCEIRVRTTASSVAYVKFAQKASGFAIAGVAALLDPTNQTVKIGITGVSAKPYRAKAVEQYLKGKELIPETLAKAAHLAQVNTRRALERAASR